MAKAKGRTRQNRRLVDKTVSPVVAEYHPDRANARLEAREFDIVGTGARVFHGLWLDDRNQIIDFCLTLSLRTGDGGWEVVVRIDCAHSEAHVHRFDAEGREDRRVIRHLKGQSDVPIALEAAETMFYDQLDIALFLWDTTRRGTR